jgi:tRNA modification GTPase
VTDTIFALSSGLPPAGIAIVRISGRRAGDALRLLIGKDLSPRRAVRCRFRSGDGFTLDDGLALWFPGTATATGEPVAELHLHGGRAVVAAVLEALAAIDGLRAATAGEFTRRAFENGRIDLGEAEGLADLLAAETEGQRRAALALAEGGLSRLAGEWQAEVLRLSAQVEAALDFSDEDDVAEGSGAAVYAALAALLVSLEEQLRSPPAERLRDGVRVVLAGPPNSGKSSLFNALVGRQAAIVTDIAGTTRDRIEAPVVIDGIPLLIIDTAGLRDDSGDAIEAIGMVRTGEALAEADVILWLGPEQARPTAALLIAAKADLGATDAGLPVSAHTGAGLGLLRDALIAQATALLPTPGALALNARHRAILRDVALEIEAAHGANDLLITAEHLRTARNRLDALTGRSGVEDMLDALFGAFCIGK